MKMMHQNQKQKVRSKIYLAKSNRANPDHVQLVRKTLLDFDVEIVEYKGGGYSHKPMLACEMLIVLPELDESIEHDEYVPLGKGLHEQIVAFQSKSMITNECDILLVNDCNDSYGPYICGLDEIDVADEDDYVNYSLAYLDFDSNGSLKSLLKNRIGDMDCTETTSTYASSNKSRYRLLLTKK